MPDVSFFAAGRIPLDAHGRLVDDVLIPPDLAIEILSRGDTVKRMTEKLDFRVSQGVRLGWLAQPTRERVFVFRPGRSVEILETGADLSGEGILPGFTLPIVELFGWLTPRR